MARWRRADRAPRWRRGRFCPQMTRRVLDRLAGHRHACRPTDEEPRCPPRSDPSAILSPSTERNDVVLVGRLGGDIVPRSLPSGDELVAFRVIVRRAPGRAQATASTRRREPTVDTVDCAVRTAALRRSVGRWCPGDLVEVHGSLRRRFWRAGGMLASRYEVEVTRARRLRRATEDGVQLQA